MKKFIFNSGQRNEWHKIINNNFSIMYSGRKKSIENFRDQLLNISEFNVENLKKILNSLNGNFAFCFESNEYFVASVDRVRSIPIFYALQNDVFYFSGCARKVQELANKRVLNLPSQIEFSTSGYTLGEKTIYEDLYQLQAGETLFVVKKNNNVNKFRYFIYGNNKFFPSNEKSLIENLEISTNQIFDRLVNDLQGRKVWIPLSGGYDSTLVAAKLAERKYRSVSTFSYGKPGNHDSFYSQKRSKILGYDWHFCHITGKKVRDFYNSKLKEAFWNYSDGLSSIPCDEGIIPLLELIDKKMISKDDVIINGSTGDFITGNHIFPELKNTDISLEQMLELFVQKHFSLWSNLLIENKNNLLNTLRNEIMEFQNKYPSSELHSINEYLEWQGRQAKYITHAQRVYDFLNLKWKLPLWDTEWTDFWPKVPLQYKLNRVLLKKYLKEWNYKGLFAGDFPNISPWPGSSKIFYFIAQIVGLTGKNSKKMFYNYFRYFNNLGYQWKAYPYKKFLRNASIARSVLALHVESWLETNCNLILKQKK